jgi:hypothetical protein
MVAAKRSLSPKAQERIELERARKAADREVAKRRQYHSAIRVLALHGAKAHVKKEIRARGLKIWDFTARQITELAELYAKHNWSKLVHDAQITLATWKEFRMPNPQGLLLCKCLAQMEGRNDRRLCQGQH